MSPGPTATDAVVSTVQSRRSHTVADHDQKSAGKLLEWGGVVLESYWYLESGRVNDFNCIIKLNQGWGWAEMMGSCSTFVPLALNATRSPPRFGPLCSTWSEQGRVIIITSGDEEVKLQVICSLVGSTLDWEGLDSEPGMPVTAFWVVKSKILVSFFSFGHNEGARRSLG